MKVMEVGKVKLRLVGEEGSQVLMRVKRTTQMKKMKRAFSLKSGLPVDFLELFVNGDKVDDDNTPEDLEMEEEDMVEVQNKIPIGWRAIESLKATHYVSIDGKKFNSLRAVFKFLSLVKADPSGREKTSKVQENPAQEGKTVAKAKNRGIIDNLRKTALLKNCLNFRKKINRSMGY